MNGKIYVFSGPSGVGKSTLISMLIKRIKGLGYSVSHTSRPPRKNEVNGVDYHFVDRDTFSRMIEDGAFVEWANVYDDLYGTSFSSLKDQTEEGEIDVVLDIDSQGAESIRRRFNESVLIYILPPSLEVLEERLRARATDEEDVIGARFNQALEELQKCGFYDYLIINDELEKAFKEVESIILSDRCRKSRIFPRIKEMFKL